MKKIIYFTVILSLLTSCTWNNNSNTQVTKKFAPSTTESFSGASGGTLQGGKTLRP